MDEINKDRVKNKKKKWEWWEKVEKYVSDKNLEFDTNLDKITDETLLTFDPNFVIENLQSEERRMQ